MRNFHEDSWQENTRRIIALTNRLCMVAEDGDSPVLRHLSDCAARIAEGDCLRAYADYHLAVHALMNTPARRISGDIFMDYLIYLAVERDHAFAQNAAKGVLDEAELAVFKGDLATLGQLAALDWRDICRMCAERIRDDKQKSRYAKDDISKMSSAVWTGLDPRFVPKSEGTPPPPQRPVFPAPDEGEWMPWSYGEAGLRGEYAADEALEEIYLQLMRSPDWRSSSEDLWNLFSEYGCGIFLKERDFAFVDGALNALEQAEDYIDLSLQENGRRALNDAVLDFMRAGVSAPISLCGVPGSGKRSLAFSLSNEFPELRTVFARAEDRALYSLIAKLGSQPLRFMLVLEGGAVPTGIISACATHQNILLLAISENPQRGELFPTTIRLEKLDIDGFTKTAGEFIAYFGGDIDALSLRNMALDQQINTRDCLNAAAAKLAAKRYMAAKL